MRDLVDADFLTARAWMRCRPRARRPRPVRRPRRPLPPRWLPGRMRRRSGWLPLANQAQRAWLQASRLVASPQQAGGGRHGESSCRCRPGHAPATRGRRSRLPSSCGVSSARAGIVARRAGLLWLPLANQAQAAQWPEPMAAGVPSCGVKRQAGGAPRRPACRSGQMHQPVGEARGRSAVAQPVAGGLSCQGREGALTGLASCSRNRCQFSCGHLRMDEAHHARPSIKASRPASSSARISEMERVESIRRIRSGSALARSW